MNDFITDNNLDFLCITETWHNHLDYFSLNQATPPGYKYIDRPRPTGRGGGIASIFKCHLKVNPISIPSIESFEHIAFKLLYPNPLIIAIIYRPPKPNPSFFSDFTDLITHLSAISPSVLLLGDFNFHIDNKKCKHTSNFLDLLDCLNLTQHVNFPTHSLGHTLDLVCSTGLTIQQLISRNLHISDHLAIIFDIHLPTPIPKKKRTISFRNIKSIQPQDFSAALSATLVKSPPLSDDLENLINHYNNSLSTCLNQLAPLKTKTVSFTHSAPWFTPDLHRLKSQKRQLERLSKKTGLTVHLQAYKDHLQLYKSALIHARSTYYSNLVQAGSNNQKALFSTISKLLKPSDNTSSSFTTDKCNSFLLFFQSKIDSIYTSLSTPPPSLVTSLAPPPPITSPLSKFSPISEDDLIKIITSMKSSTCILDPIPSSLVKHGLPTISPIITRIVNSSLRSSTVPPSLKLAAITPILKKPGLNPDVLNNFRPISNLPFLSKILERTVASQIKTHLTNNALYEQFQSGFRTHHSTETALLKVTNDLLLSSDSGLLSILILLDLTAAFDTINHSILLSRLKSLLHITDDALTWLTSYLTDRKQFVFINNCSSSTAPLSQGVPQGSVLGPLLFILYLLPLGQIIHRHGLSFHCYADDIQIYISTKSIDPQAHSTLSNCLSDISSWLQTNFLKLNCNKSDILVIGPNSLASTAKDFRFSFDNSSLTPSPHCRNLGVIFDNKLTFSQHIKAVTKTAFHHLRNIARLRPSLSFPAAETLIHAFITSRIDYCNSIIYGTTSNLLNKLQYIQNSAARLLTHTRSRDHITPVLQNLHWLPVPYRIKFKILLLTHKALHNQAPSYLKDLLHPYTPSRTLRTANSNLLTVPRTRHRTWGDRAFSVAAPSLWNSLPQHIRDTVDPSIFKSKLKTHLFRTAFNPSPN